MPGEKVVPPRATNTDESADTSRAHVVTKNEAAPAAHGGAED